MKKSKFSFSQRIPNLFAVLALTFLFACGPKDETPLGKYEGGVLVINEGNFSDSDGELSFYSPSTGTATNRIFQAENGRPLSAIIQNVRRFDDKIYLVCNRADKVEVLNAADGKSFASVASQNQNLVNPQDIAVVGNKAFITCWGPFSPTFSRDAPFLAIMSTQTNTIIGRVNLAGFPQGCLKVGQNIYIALPGANQVAVLNPATDQIASTIPVANGPQRLYLDANNRIWVVCSSGALVRINPSTNQVETTISTGTVRPNGKAAMNGAGNRLYYMSSVFNATFTSSTGTVYELPITATTAPTTPLFTLTNLYGLGVDPNSGEILAADANAFQGNGTVVRYDAQGTRLGTFAVGRGPNGFLFQ
jgi:YVTN family beta-propeller protein